MSVFEAAGGRKIDICIKYKEEYPPPFWINADNDESFGETSVARTFAALHRHCHRAIHYRKER
jgi:hypothetical protein